MWSRASFFSKTKFYDSTFKTVKTKFLFQSDSEVNTPYFTVLSFSFLSHQLFQWKWPVWISVLKLWTVRFYNFSVLNNFCNTQNKTVSVTKYKVLLSELIMPHMYWQSSTPQVHVDQLIHLCTRTAQTHWPNQLRQIGKLPGKPRLDIIIPLGKS